MQCIRQFSARLSAHSHRCFSRLALTAFRQTQPPSHINPSRLALSATHAVHKFLKDRALEHSFYVVNSLRYAALPESQKQDKVWDAIRTSLLTVPPGVSPRLPAHALIHGLVRIGMPQQASALATSMMNSGFRVRCKTLEKVVDGLTKVAADKKAARHASEIHFKEYMANLLATPKILSFNASMTSNPNTAFALELLRAAKESGSQRSNVIFNTLITLCLINGEIILAALLFGILVKDWEHRSVVLTQMTAGLPEAPEAVQPSEDVNKARRFDLMSKLSQPQHWTLKEIMVPIREKLAKATIEDIDKPEFQEVLQSLAYLASLLDERKLPFEQVSSIIHALANCPTITNWIWVKKGQEVICVPANRYFHGVLFRLVRSLPDKNPKKRSVAILSSKITSIRYQLIHPIHGMQPPLDLPSYNTLMHYALRNRFSPALARQVYEHMTVKRDRPIRHTAVSHAIFLRAAALYGRKDVTGGAVQVLQDYIGPPHSRPVVPAKPKFSNLPRRLVHAGRSRIKLPPAPPLDVVLNDKYSLSTYLTTLLSCNRQKTVYRLMLRFLPYFSRGCHHNNSPLYRSIRRDAWDQSIANAAALGPYVLCAFVIALTRAGYLSKLMTLFKMVFLASSKSLESEENGWHVTIPIYTAVLQGRYIAHHRQTRGARSVSLERLLQTTKGIYERVTRNVRSGIGEMGTPDARFYAAMLKILSKLIPAPKSSIQDAKHHLDQARKLYADTGFTEKQGLEPLIEKLAEDMQENGYTIPVGFQYLFFGKRMSILGNPSDTPELERRPFAFKKYPKVGGPYSIPVYNYKSIPLRRHPFPRKRASAKRRTSE